ncbi:hypothetical protein [Neoactinobaculum massilliense]|uniref:hypothetical protein n=1 Tax=Neoactinobaculum massilliense TaxID=2364794 RepID=UPI000F537AA5|nr:hypothetical protein [Neoactinobaculum massilliense]
MFEFFAIVSAVSFGVLILTTLLDGLFDDIFPDFDGVPLFTTIVFFACGFGLVGMFTSANEMSAGLALGISAGVGVVIAIIFALIYRALHKSEDLGDQNAVGKFGTIRYDLHNGTYQVATALSGMPLTVVATPLLPDSYTSGMSVIITSQNADGTYVFIKAERS